VAGSLKEGHEFTSEINKKYKIKKFLGSGGQGEVYEVSAGKEKYALKWYLPHVATSQQYEILEDLITKGAPDSSFLWPKDLIKDGDDFGYIMDLRPPEYLNMFELLKRRVEPSFKILCLIGFNIAKGFRELHSNGWCYRDISWGNLFINFNNGKVLICDNDNAVPNNSDLGNIGGTPRFMAPEIVLGKDKPSTNTDLFSLAILLFYLFNIHHPFEGKLEDKIHCLDPHAMKEIYGTNPVFIWDPNNKSNRPVPGYQQNAIDFWELYPQFFKDIFTHAFTEGLHNPQKRSTEGQWQSTCLKLLNSIIYCNNEKCGVENFYDQKLIKIGVGCTCWNCQRIIPSPSILLINNDLIVLSKETNITQHHANNDFNIDNIIGKVVQNPNNPNQWGIKNLSSEIWTFIKPGGQSILVDPGKSFPLIKGSIINFGINKAKIY